MPSTAARPRPVTPMTSAVLTALACGALIGLASCARPTGSEEHPPQGPRPAFAALADWDLKAENLSARGSNPLFVPLEPGYRYILQNPGGPQRVEGMVLEETEPFDIAGIGRFECAILQEEKIVDDVPDELTQRWVAIDKTTQAVYTFGEVSWEYDEAGDKVFAGTWRAGEPDGSGLAEPGLLMPGTFVAGEKYQAEGHEPEAWRYAENLEGGLRVATPAGSFTDCVRIRTSSVTNPADATERWCCPGVGTVRDGAEGELVASSALPKTDLSGFGRRQARETAPAETSGPKITEAQATEIALQEVPGKVTSIKIERKGRYTVYAVEIVAKSDGVETDVLVDIYSGKVVGTEK